MDELFDDNDDLAQEDVRDKDDRATHVSDDSFIVDDEGSADEFDQEPEERDDLDDDYDFLFGLPQEEKEVEEKKVKKRVKDLEKLLSSRAGAYEEFEGTEDEIRYTLEDLSYHYQHRQALESEILSLFSGLVKREKISQAKSHIDAHGRKEAENAEQESAREGAEQNQAEARTYDKYKLSRGRQSEQSINKFLKNVIKQTFRDKAPEGRFGKFSKTQHQAGADGGVSARLESEENLLVTIDSEALANLRDINTLLHRERRGDYDELDGVALYKYPHCASLYIFSQNFITSFILPLCSIINRGSVSEEIDVDLLINELIYFFYQITQPPSENWYNYWVTAQNIYKVVNVQLMQAFKKDPNEAPNKSFKKDEEKNNNVMRELKYRTRVIDSYINGLRTLRGSMENSEIWSIIGEFRLKLEHFKQNNYMSKEESHELEELRERQQKLSVERDDLIREIEGDDEDGAVLNRLRKEKDASAAGKMALSEKKRRVKEIRRELYDVTTKINEANKRIDTARSQSEFHMQTVRILISQVLTIQSNMGILYIFNEFGLLTIIRQELLLLFSSIRKAIVPVTYVPEADATLNAEGKEAEQQPQPEVEKEEYEYYPSYLTQTERGRLWHYIRIVYSILTGVNVPALVGTSAAPEAAGAVPAAGRDSSRSREQLLEERDRMERNYLIELYRMNPRLYNKFNDKLYNFNVRSANYNQKNSYHYIFKYAHPASGVPEASRDERDRESLQKELNMLIGINSSLEHISLYTEREGDLDRREIDYELVLMLLICCYDINREVEEEYYEPYDRVLLFTIKSFVIRYYSLLYLKRNGLGGPGGLRKSFLFLAIKRYIGEDNIFTRLLLTYLNLLIKKFNHQNNQIIVQLLQNTFIELSFVRHFHGSAMPAGSSSVEGSASGETELAQDQLVQEEENINNICKELFVEYIKNNIRQMLFNVLKNYKLCYNRALFISAARLALLLEKIMLKVGTVEFVPVTGFGGNERLLGKDTGDIWDEDDEEEDQWDAVSRRRVVRVDSRNIYNSKNNNFIRNDIVRNGRIVYNALLILVNKGGRGSETLLQYLRKVPKALFYDFKYLLLFNSHLTTRPSDARDLKSALSLGGHDARRGHWSEEERRFFLEVVESFLDKWLLEGNKAIVLEPFYNKNVPTVASVTGKLNYNVNSKYYIDPVESNDYSSCPILQGVLEEDQEDIVDIMNNLAIARDDQKVDRKAKIDDELLLRYYNRFKFMNEGVVPYLADLLNIPARHIQKHLDELLNPDADGFRAAPTKSDREPKLARGSKEVLERALGRFYANHGSDAVDSLLELYDNLRESVEMFNLGGAEVEVIEPIQLTDEMRKSEHYRTLLREFNVDAGRNLLMGVAGIEPKLAVLNQFIGNPVAAPDAEEPEPVPEPQQFDDEPVDVYNITSRDIVKLLIQINSLYIRPSGARADVDGRVAKSKPGDLSWDDEAKVDTGLEGEEHPREGEGDQTKVAEQAKDGEEKAPERDESPKSSEGDDGEAQAEAQKREISELLDLALDVVENSDKEGYMRYFQLNFSLDPDGGETSRRLVRRLLKFCNIAVQENTLRLLDRAISPEIIKNRINIIRSLHHLSREQLEAIQSKQEEQEVGPQADFDDEAARETLHYEDADEQVYDFSEFEFGRDRRPAQDVGKKDDVPGAEADLVEGAEAGDAGVSVIRRDLGKIKKNLARRPREKRRKKLKRSELRDGDEDAEPGARAPEPLDLGEFADYRELVAVRLVSARDPEDDRLERRCQAEFAQFKRMPDLVLDLHSRSLALAREGRLVNGLTRGRLAQIASTLS